MQEMRLVRIAASKVPDMLKQIKASLETHTTAQLAARVRRQRTAADSAMAVIDVTLPAALPQAGRLHPAAAHVLQQLCCTDVSDRRGMGGFAKSNLPCLLCNRLLHPACICFNKALDVAGKSAESGHDGSRMTMNRQHMTVRTTVHSIFSSAKHKSSELLSLPQAPTPDIDQVVISQEAGWGTSMQLHGTAQAGTPVPNDKDMDRHSLGSVDDAVVTSASQPGTFKMLQQLHLGFGAGLCLWWFKELEPNGSVVFRLSNSCT